MSSIWTLPLTVDPPPADSASQFATLWRLLLFMGVQILPLLLGYRLKVIGVASESWGKPLSRFIIIVMNTAVVLMGAWGLNIVWADQGRMFAIGVIFGLCMTVVGLLMSRFHTQDRTTKGGYIVATPISNFGFTMAGFVSYMLFGQVGISIQSVYIFPLVLLIYLFWFPMSRFYGSSGGEMSLIKSTLLALVSANSLPILGTLAGVALHAAGSDLPEALAAYVLPVCVYFGTMLSMFTIGVTLQPQSVGQYLPQNVSVAISKFLLAPAIGWGLCWVFGIEGLNRAVVLVCSSAPVGLFSSFAASIFGLNRNLTNSLFIVNTALYLLAVLPLLFWLLPLTVGA